MELQPLVIQLEKRRRQLGMSCAVIARHAGLGLRTVQRALADGPVAPEIGTLAAIARAMGASIQIDLKAEPVVAFRREQAERKAAQLASLTQGTSALEAQAISTRALAKLKRRTVSNLMHGSSRRLWAD